MGLLVLVCLVKLPQGGGAGGLPQHCLFLPHLTKCCVYISEPQVCGCHCSIGGETESLHGDCSDHCSQVI